jgi:hypothetical protein
MNIPPIQVFENMKFKLCQKKTTENAKQGSFYAINILAWRFP